MRLFQRLSAIAVAFTIIACSSGADPEPAEPDAGEVAADTQIFQDTSPDVEPADTAAPDPDAADPIDAATVTRAKKAIGGREIPWTEKELLKIK